MELAVYTYDATEAEPIAQFRCAINATQAEIDRITEQYNADGLTVFFEWE